MAWRSNKKGLAIVGLFLFLMGVVVPATFGLLTEKAMDLGVGDLLDKSTNWDSSNIANSTYFIGEDVEFLDNQTGNWYRIDTVYDSSSDMSVGMLDTNTVISSGKGITDAFVAWIVLNKTAILNRVDKIVVLFIEDTGGHSLDGVHVYVYLQDWKWGEDYKFCIGDYNATEAYNKTLKVIIPIDAIKRLKIQSSADNPTVMILLKNPSKLHDLNNMIVGYRVELYDVKKVNATAASNIMLATSGILGWLGALAATPYWNPVANREHRNIRGAYKKVRGKVRIPRRRR